MNGIYQIRNLISGKLYIGSSVNPPSRWRQHVCTLRKGTHKNQRLQHAWLKYGEAAFVFEIIETVDDHRVLDEREQYWIDLTGVIDDRCGYNINGDARRRLPHTPETMSKHWAARRKNGTDRASEELKKQQRLRMLGTKQSAATIEKKRNALLWKRRPDTSIRLQKL